MRKPSLQHTGRHIPVKSVQIESRVAAMPARLAPATSSGVFGVDGDVPDESIQGLFMQVRSYGLRADVRVQHLEMPVFAGSHPSGAGYAPGDASSRDLYCRFAWRAPERCQQRSAVGVTKWQEWSVGRDGESTANPSSSLSPKKDLASVKKGACFAKPRCACRCLRRRAPMGPSS